MTSRERVRATLAGHPTDRTPSHFRAEPEVFDKLKGHLQLPDDEAVRRWARSDFRDLGVLCNTGGYGGYNSFGWSDRQLPDGQQADFWGVRRKRVTYDGGTYVDIVHAPLASADGIDALRRYAFPDPGALFDFADLPAVARSINRDEPRFLMIEGESLFDRCWALRGIEGFMMDLVSDEDSARFLIEGNAKFFRDYTRRLLESANGALDAIGIYNDLGHQHGMMISPELYRKYFKAQQRDYIRMVRSFGVHVFYHSCGGIGEILDDLVEIGIDILDPLQLPALHMTPAQLAARCGGRVTLHGGIDTQDLLVHGTPATVRAAVRELKRELGKHGKYILSGSHLFQVDVPLVNIAAVVDAGRGFE